MKQLCFITLTLVSTLIPTAVMAYGEGEDIPMDARAIHLLTNDARTDTTEALAECGTKCSEFADNANCYDKTLPPLYWDDAMYRAAQFHANMLTIISKADNKLCMQHDSPCTLVSTAATDFPATCDGNPSCACQGGKATCGTTGTGTFERLKMFSSTPRSENLASAGGVLGSFRLWLLEDGKGSGCEFTGSNGHRWNILSKDNKAVGVGYTDKIAAQDFSYSTTENAVLTAGAHYTENTSTWFKTHYYSTKAVEDVRLRLGNQCFTLTQTRGTKTHGTWGTHDASADGRCVAYFFEAKASDGTIARFPTTGSLLYQCDKSWGHAEAASCFAANSDDTCVEGQYKACADATTAVVCQNDQWININCATNDQVCDNTTHTCVTKDNGGEGGEGGQNGEGGEGGQNGEGGEGGDNGGEGDEGGQNGEGGEGGQNGEGGDNGDNGEGGNGETGENHTPSHAQAAEDGCSTTMTRATPHGLGMLILGLLGLISLFRRRKVSSNERMHH